jgi:hypothetical protein
LDDRKFSIKTYHGATETRRKKSGKKIFLGVSAVDVHFLIADS